MNEKLESLRKGNENIKQENKELKVQIAKQDIETLAWEIRRMNIMIKCVEDQEGEKREESLSNN